MPALPILSFHIDKAPYSSEFDEEGAPAQLGLEVTPLLDGVPLMKGDVFDAVDLLLYGVGNAETDLYTCSCGVAGCAGFHEEVRLCEGAATMAWEFPEEPYRTRLAGERFPAGQPLRLEFDKTQYAQALAGLEAELAALFAASEVPVVVHPGWSCEQLDASGFADMMDKARARRARWDARMAACRAAEGALRDFAFLAELPGGEVASRDLAGFAWDQVHDLHLADDEANIEHLRSVVGPQLLANPLAALLALPGAGRADAFQSPGLGLPDEAWLAAQYSVLPVQDAHARVQAYWAAARAAADASDASDEKG